MTFRLPVVDIALEGFRITRENPAAVAVWGVWLFLSSLVTDALVAASGLGPVLDQMGKQAGRTDPAAAQATLAALGQAGPVLPAIVLVTYAFGIVFYTALLRAVLRPGERGRTFYLRAGPDELRQLGLLVLVILTLLAYTLGLFLASGVLLAAALALGPGGQFFAALVMAGLFVALLYPVVRLSLAPAATFQAGRITLFRTWALTRGLFWPMLASYALAVLLAGLVWLLAMIVFGALGFAAALASGGGLEALRDVMKPDLSSVRTLFTPASLATLAFASALGALVYTVTLSTAPALQRALQRLRPEAALFD